MKGGLRNFDSGICYQQENKVKIIFNLSHVLKEKELILLLKRGQPMNLFWSKLEESMGQPMIYRSRSSV